MRDISLLFEKSKKGLRCTTLPALDVPEIELDEKYRRQAPLHLPEVSEIDLSRHYCSLSKRVYSVGDGMYPLGSCTMKYNPKVNEAIACLKGFTELHPLQEEWTVQGALEAMDLLQKYLCEITGMDAITLQPAAGAHGELTGMLIVRAYHESRKDDKRKKVIIPDSAHGTNPASAAMAGFTVVNIPSGPDGLVDLAALEKAVGEDTAAFMLTNPNTLGLFEKNIEKIAEIVHKAGGLLYYDGANLNAIMGQSRPGDMGYDVIHLNLHKTFSTPHGGGGPGSGPVGCKDFLKRFLPLPAVVYDKDQKEYRFSNDSPDSIGKVRAFYGNFLVYLKALAYILSLGAEGVSEASSVAVLNANYLMKRLKEKYDVPYDTLCMHEFVLSLERLKKEKDVSAMDIAKGMIDEGIHPPTTYFPLIVHEAMMFEPTETESKDTLDRAADVLLKLYEKAESDPESMHKAPVTSPVTRLDEVGAARNPRLTWPFENQ